MLSSFNWPIGRAVRAFHVVGVNLQLRLGVRRRVVGKQQIFVGLLGVGFLRRRVHINPAVENAPRFVVQNPVEILVAGAMRLRVFHNHVMVRQLLAARQIQAVEDALQTFARQVGANIIARYRAPSAKECTFTLLPRPNSPAMVAI